MSNIGNLGDKRGSKGYQPGQSGNPGGRPKIVNIVRAAGFDPEELRAEVLKTLVEAMRALHPGDKDEGASWRFAVQHVGYWLIGKPAEMIETKSSEPEMTEDEYKAELKLIVQEAVAAMTPEERMAMLGETVQ